MSTPEPMEAATEAAFRAAREVDGRALQLAAETWTAAIRAAAPIIAAAAAAEAEQHPPLSMDAKLLAEIADLRSRLSAYEGLVTAARAFVDIENRRYDLTITGDAWQSTWRVTLDGLRTALDGPSSPPQDTVERPAHVYVSTACLHGEHAYCAAGMRADGTRKEPGQCKFCSAPCQCTECDHTPPPLMRASPECMVGGRMCEDCDNDLGCDCPCHAAAPPTDTEVNR